MVDVKINGCDQGGSAQSNNFQPLFGKKTCISLNKDFKEYLMKWSMKGRIFCQCYSFDSHFRPHSAKEFLTEFFSDPTVTSSLLTVSDSGKEVIVGEKATTVEATKITCSHTTLDIFNKLSGEIVREDGQIKRCFDEWIDDIQISDQLRQLLLNEDSEPYLLYDEAERDEFLFRLLMHFCIGGRLCQFEDEVNPYLDVVKNLYKDLITVQKDSETKQLQIISHVYQVELKDNEGRSYYPDTEPMHRNTFAYVIIDPLLRQLFVLHHRFGNGLF